MRKFNVAVVGATGAVGNEMISVLEQRDFPVGEIRFLASERSIGKELEFKGKSYPVEVLGEEFVRRHGDRPVFGGRLISQKFAPIAAAAGCVVVDNTSAFQHGA